MCPAVFGWGLCTFYTGLLETLDARKLKSELEKKKWGGGGAAAARDRSRWTQAAAEHL